MRQKKIFIMVLIVAISMFPTVLKAQTASSPTAPTISEAEVQEFVNKYIDRFKAMDLISISLMNQFRPRIERGERGRGREHLTPHGGLIPFQFANSHLRHSTVLAMRGSRRDMFRAGKQGTVEAGI